MASKKLFVVSDVHGHYTLMKNALDQAGFDKNNQSHFLVCCGDYFDRGRENVQVLQFFERLERKVLLRGNHEDLLLKLLQTGKLLPHHYINGTLQTMEDFFGKYFADPQNDTIDFSGKTRAVDRLCDFIESTVNYFETQNYVFVHGWLPDTENLQAATGEDWANARWIKWTEKYTGERPLPDKILICGHMPVLFADKFDPERERNCPEVFYGNGLIAVDAGTFDSQHINVLVLEENML